MSNLEGVKIAICTSDSREGTHEFLTKLSLDPLVDMVLCGDDKDSISKPNPHNALFICDKLGVSPEQTIMVGDTPANTIMGQTASLGLTVGVLSGIDTYKLFLHWKFTLRLPMWFEYACISSESFYMKNSTFIYNM